MPYLSAFRASNPEVCRRATCLLKVLKRDINFRINISYAETGLKWIRNALDWFEKLKYTQRSGENNTLIALIPKKDIICTHTHTHVHIKYIVQKYLHVK